MVLTMNLLYPVVISFIQLKYIVLNNQITILINQILGLHIYNITLVLNMTCSTRHLKKPLHPFRNISHSPHTLYYPHFTGNLLLLRALSIIISCKLEQKLITPHPKSSWCIQNLQSSNKLQLILSDLKQPKLSSTHFSNMEPRLSLLLHLILKL